MRSCRGAFLHSSKSFANIGSSRMHESQNLIPKGSCNASYNDYLFSAVCGRFIIIEVRESDGV